MLLPGILYLRKTFGRKGSDFLYKFRPDNREYGDYFVPYKINNVLFSKIIYDIYALVEISDDTTNIKIKKIIGCTKDLESYYKYQLYCKDLILPQLTASTQDSKENSTIQNIVDRTDYKVFTIDGVDTTDYDDAFSIRVNGDTIISIYISNIYVALESFLNVWKNLGGYVSNIYLPNERITMLCKEINEICNLKAGNDTIAFTMDYNVEQDSYTFLNTKINVYKNYAYDDVNLEQDTNYKKIAEILNINDSSKLVEYLMRLMCFKAGEFLYDKKVGIFRTINEPLEDILPSNNYITYNNIINGQAPYAHITSPMRRLVDIINQVHVLSYISDISQEALAFLEQWSCEEKLIYVNKMSKSIKRVQNESALLCLYDQIKDNIYAGKILESETFQRDGVYHYTVFLKELYLIAPFHSCEKLQGTYNFKLYKFDKESLFRKKIRLGII